MADTSEPRLGHRMLLQNEVATPIGCLRLAGAIVKGRGVETMPHLRVYGRYAVVCLLEGHGLYRDVQGTACPVGAGQVILVFPELAHIYAPYPGDVWDEFYVTFDGPVFDLWRQTNLLSPQCPVLPAPTPDWPDRLRHLIEEATLLATVAGRLEQINRFLLLLGELLQPTEEQTDRQRTPDWVTRTQAMMDINLGEEISLPAVAASVGMSYETFRKRFLQATGMTPVRYRLQRRIAAACELLRYSPQMTNRQAAEILGFADEFHFSKRFSQVTGITPKAFRLEQ